MYILMPVCYYSTLPGSRQLAQVSFAEPDFAAGLLISIIHALFAIIITIIIVTTTLLLHHHLLLLLQHQHDANYFGDMGHDCMYLLYIYICVYII